MSRKKRPIVEIVPASEAALVPRLPDEVMLERIVRERIDQILAAHPDLIMRDDFQPRPVSDELLRRGTVFERRKWSLYFEKWGCRVCGRKDVAHGSTGHCQPCFARIYNRLKQLKAEFEKAHPDREIERQIDRITSKIRTAKALLSDADVEGIRRRFEK